MALNEANASILMVSYRSLMERLLAGPRSCGLQGFCKSLQSGLDVRSRGSPGASMAGCCRPLGHPDDGGHQSWSRGRRREG